MTTEVIGASSGSTGTATSPGGIPLSGGLGPLLSSGAATSSTSATGISSALSDTTPSVSDIHVIENTIAPTAASSDLTTLGVPESLSVNLSLVTTNPALASSAALISFGKTSPAVYSTVLAPGSSLGTSSQTLTTYSTVSLGSVSLTGVTLVAPRSPTSCFTLPTPAASLEMIAVAVVPMGDYDLSNPLIFAFGDSGTIPRYVSAMASGNAYILDLSPDNPVAGQLGLLIPGNEALVFDGEGLHLYAGNCSSLTEVLVDNFFSQVGSAAGPASRRAITSQLRKRQSLASSAFTVEVAVDSYLQTKSLSPNLTFGDSQCIFQSTTKGSKSNNMIWACMYPPPVGGVASCESSLRSWVTDTTSPSTEPKNTTQVLATLGPFLSLAGDSILDLFPGSDPALGLGFTFMRQVGAGVKQAIDSVGSSACEVLHAFDSDDLVLADRGPLGTRTIGSYMTAPPPSLAVNLAASATAAITGLPRRKVNPTDNFLKQIATDFKSLLGAFTHWLGGLPHLPHLTLGLEVTQGPPVGMILTPPTITNPSATTLATPSMAHVQIPTVTVTHFMGDGWYNPSTYAVAAGASTVSDFPAFPRPSDLGTKSLSMHLNWIALEAHTSLVSSSSTPTYLSDNMIASVLSQLAAMERPDTAGAQPGHHWTLPDPPQGHVNSAMGITTSGPSLGYDGHVVVVTTTVYLSNASTQE